MTLKHVTLTSKFTELKTNTMKIFIVSSFLLLLCSKYWWQSSKQFSVVSSQGAFGIIPLFYSVNKRRWNVICKKEAQLGGSRWCSMESKRCKSWCSLI